MELRVIEFHLGRRSVVAPTAVDPAVRRPAAGPAAHGYQLPTSKDVVAKVAINPNTCSRPTVTRVRSLVRAPFRESARSLPGA